MLQEQKKDSPPEETDFRWQQIWQRMPSGHGLVSVLDLNEANPSPSKKSPT